MPFMVDVSRRNRQPEIMDQPGLDRQQHFHALQGLERLNRWSGSVRVLWPPIRDLAREHPSEPLRILDIATGGGDLPISLWKKARKAGIEVKIDGCDLSNNALDYARQRAAHVQAPIRFFQLDAISGPIPPGYDALISSLFFHHLEEEQVTNLLRRMKDAAGRMVLINDLIRNRACYALAYLGTRLLTTSPMVHVDGPLSIQAAFTMEEIRTLAKRAGLEEVSIVRRLPCRFLLMWRRP